MTDSNAATQSFHDKRNPMILSYSGISSYQTCRERWKLQNVYGLRKTTATYAMDVGSAVHHALEHMLLGTCETPEQGVESWVKSIWAKVPADDGDEPDGASLTLLEDHLNEVQTTAVQVVPRVVNEILNQGLSTVMHPVTGAPLVEQELTVDLPGWDGFASHIDWIAADPEGNIWVIDFKTRKTFQTDDDELVNLQNAVYVHMVRTVLGLDIAGTKTFQVRSDPMRSPKVNKNGTVSKAAVVCDWDTYAAVVIEAGQDPADYLDMRDKLSTVRWTEVLTAYRSVETVERVWDGIVRPVAHEMANARDRLMSADPLARQVGARQASRTLSQRTCNGCSVRDVCLNALRGWDVTSHLQGFRYRREIVQDAAERGLL